MPTGDALVRLALTLPLTLGLALAAACAAWAGALGLDPDSPFEITARRIDYEEAGRLYVADGDVRLVQGARRLAADWVAFSLESRRGVASGGVRLEDGDQLVEAEFMAFDLESLRGTIFEGEIDTGEQGFRIRARELLKTGDAVYEMHEGVFTACRCPGGVRRVPWQIESKRAEVEIGGYGKARSSTVDVLGVPVLWLPWFVYPVKTERETGLLLPELAVGGRNGVQVGLPFFWAVRPQLNLILTPRYVEKRGFKPDLELEYVLGRRSEGRVYGSYVRDTSYRVGHAPPHVRDRWGIALDHDQFLPLGWRARADVRLVSDNLYLDDFDDYGLYRRDLFLRSSLFAFRHFGRQGRVGVVGAMRYADDIQHASEQDRDGALLHRWPDLSLRLLPGRQRGLEWLGLVTALDAGYAYFHSLDDPRSAFPTAPVGPQGFFLDTGIDPAVRADEADGAYQEGEPMLDSGHRLVLHPRLGRPLSLPGGLDLRPEVGYSQTLYGARRQGFAERGIWTAGADLRGRVRGRLDWLGLDRTGHQLEPFVGWSFVRPRGQAGNPVFVPPSPTPQRRLRQLALENRALDPSDRVPATQVLAVGLDNRLRAGPRRGAPGRLVADFRLAFEHDFESGGSRQLVLDGRARPSGWLRSDFNLVWNASTSEIDEGLLGATWHLPAWRFLSHGRLGGRYRYLRRVPPIAEQNASGVVDQIDAGGGVRLFGLLQLEYGFAYSLDAGRRLASGGSAVYASRCRCWALGVEIREEPGRDVYYGIRYRLTGLGDDRGDPFALANGLFSRRGR